MANKTWKLEDFSGGLDLLSSQNDTLENKAISGSVNFDIDSKGVLRTAGSFIRYDDYPVDTLPCNYKGAGEYWNTFQNDYSELTSNFDPTYGLFPGGKGLIHIKTDYRIFDEDGVINEGYITFQDVPIEITLIANNHYFHIRQEVEGEYQLKENVVSLARDGFNPVYDATNQNPDWLLPETYDFEVDPHEHAYADHEVAPVYMVSPSHYITEKAITISDSNFLNNNVHNPFSESGWTVLAKKLFVQIEDLFGEETVDVVSFIEGRLPATFGYAMSKGGAGSGFWTLEYASNYNQTNCGSHKEWQGDWETQRHPGVWMAHQSNNPWWAPTGEKYPHFMGSGVKGDVAQDNLWRNNQNQFSLQKWSNTGPVEITTIWNHDFGYGAWGNVGSGFNGQSSSVSGTCNGWSGQDTGTYIRWSRWDGGASGSAAETGLGYVSNRVFFISENYLHRRYDSDPNDELWRPEDYLQDGSGNYISSETFDFCGYDSGGAMVSSIWGTDLFKRYGWYQDGGHTYEVPTSNMYSGFKAQFDAGTVSGRLAPYPTSNPESATHDLQPYPNIDRRLWDHYRLHAENNFHEHGGIETRHEGYGEFPTSNASGYTGSWSHPFRLACVPKPEPGDDTPVLYNVAEAKEAVVCFGGSVDPREMATTPGQMYSVYVTVLGFMALRHNYAGTDGDEWEEGRIKWSQKVMVGDEWDDGISGDLWHGGLRYYWFKKRFKTQQENDDAPSGYPAPLNVVDYSTGIGDTLVNDTNPGLYNFGARALIQLRERDHNIEGFTNPDVPLPPFPWYNIHLCDIDLHDANNFGIGVFANPATENYAHAWSWCMDLADVRVEKIQYNGRDRYNPEPWNIEIIEPTQWDSSYYNDPTTAAILDKMRDVSPELIDGAIHAEGSSTSLGDITEGGYGNQYNQSSNYWWWLEQIIQDNSIPGFGNFDYFGGDYIPPGHDIPTFAGARAHIGGSPLWAEEIAFMEPLQRALNDNSNFYMPSPNGKSTQSPLFLRAEYGALGEEWAEATPTKITCIPQNWDDDAWMLGQPHIYAGNWGFLAENPNVTTGCQRGRFFESISAFKTIDMQKRVTPQGEWYVNKGLEYINEDGSVMFDVNDEIGVPTPWSGGYTELSHLEPFVLEFRWDGGQINRKYFNQVLWQNDDEITSQQLNEWTDISQYPVNLFDGTEIVSNQVYYNSDPEAQDVGECTVTISTTWNKFEVEEGAENAFHEDSPTLIRWGMIGNSNTTILDSGGYWYGDQNSEVEAWGEVYLVNGYFDHATMLAVELYDNTESQVRAWVDNFNEEGLTGNVFKARISPADEDNPQTHTDNYTDVTVSNMMLYDDFMPEGYIAPSLYNQLGPESDAQMRSKVVILFLEDVATSEQMTNPKVWVPNIFQDIPEIKITFENTIDYDLVGFIPHYTHLAQSHAYPHSVANVDAVMGGTVHQAKKWGLSPSYIYMMMMAMRDEENYPHMWEGILSWLDEPFQAKAFLDAASTEQEKGESSILRWYSGWDGDDINVIPIIKSDSYSFSYNMLNKVSAKTRNIFDVPTQLNSQDWFSIPQQAIDWGHNGNVSVYHDTIFGDNQPNNWNNYILQPTNYTDGDGVTMPAGGTGLTNSWWWYSMVACNLVFVRKDVDSGVDTAEGINAEETQIDVSSTANFTLGDIILIGTEKMKIEAIIDSDTIQVKRGYAATTRYDHEGNGEPDVQNIYWTNRSKNIVTDKIPVYKDMQRMKDNFDTRNVHAVFNHGSNNGMEMYSNIKNMLSDCLVFPGTPGQLHTWEGVADWYGTGHPAELTASAWGLGGYQQNLNMFGDVMWQPFTFRQGWFYANLFYDRDISDYWSPL